jgi:hypothetical protein
MTIQTLSTVTLDTIENYRNAATLAVDAYRAGSHRLIDAVNGSLENKVYSRTAKVAPNLTSALSQVRGSLSDIIVKGIDGVSSNTEKAIAVSSNAAAERVSQVADFAAGIDNRLLANGIEAAVRLSLPGAQAARAVSAKLAEGANALSRVAVGTPAKAARVVKTAKKKAVRAKRAVVAKTVKAAKTVSRKAAVAKKAPVARAKRKVAEAAVAA